MNGSVGYDYVNVYKNSPAGVSHEAKRWSQSRAIINILSLPACELACIAAESSETTTQGSQ